MKYFWIVLLLLLVSATLLEAGPTHKQVNRVGKLRGRLASVKQKKKEIRREIKKTRAAVRDVKVDIHSIDRKIEDVGTRLETTTENLANSRKAQQALGDQLTKTTERLSLVRSQVKKRLRAMYVRRGGSFMSALMGSQSVGDLASRGYLIRTVAKKDHALFDEFRQLKADLASRKQKQDELVTHIARLAGDEQSEKLELADTRDEKSGLLKKLQDKEGDLEAALAQFEADEQQISAQIAAFAERPKKFGSPGSYSNLPAFVGRFSAPVNAPITSRFGNRYHPILHRYRMHNGIDFGARYGTPIHAAADGEALRASYMNGFGNVVILDHGGGYSTVYAHASRILCTPGMMVRRGAVIALVGSTGLATGPHLHFEVHFGRTAIDPLGKF